MRILFAALFVVVSFPAFAQQHIAPTDAKSPSEELKTFNVPNGFAVQLVAAESSTQHPIDKPMQIAFDSQGKLWVTTSRHYPFPASSNDKPSDRIFVLSDFDTNGLAKNVRVFAESLNIPIGILPLADGRSCIASSAGEIRKLSDTDGDGKADRSEVLFSGFGYKDTHGMTNSFTLMPDGWVYACHGFANESEVAGRDGHTIKLQSGHTFRFRPDGSRIEVFTRGQVNPFGMTVDPFGNLYTADCHSKPITQLIRGSYYDSFGKPHDGLGYGPHATPHSHGSTALCGLAWYNARHFPKEFQGTMFLGNVVTNRINHDRIEWNGSSPSAIEQPDFLTSSDPWFRPVDIKVGPDGALYVADFYNRIIGHYEVDLKHPLRDKSRGRIWRIVHTTRQFDTASRSVPFGEFRQMAAKEKLSESERNACLAALTMDARQAREAVDVICVHPFTAAIPSLVKLLKVIPAEDTHLRHAAKIALRNILADGRTQHEIIWELKPLLSDTHGEFVDQSMIAVPSAYAGWWFSERFARMKIDSSMVAAAATLVARVGVDHHRKTTWEAIGRIDDLTRQMAAVGGFRTGLAMSRIDFQANVPDPLKEKIIHGLGAQDERKVREALQQARDVRANVGELAAQIAMDRQRSETVRMLALNTLDDLKAVGLHEAARSCLEDDRGSVELRLTAVAKLGNTKKLLDLISLKDLLTTAPYRLAVALATALAGSSEGADLLFAAVKAGKAAPRLLQEKSVLDRLAATNSRDWAARVKELTANIPSADARIARLVKDRAESFKHAKPDLAIGKQLYATNCANCHQLANVGGKIGPQLDGIGNRGAERLCEDILDPNRNIDHAFFTTQLDLKDGRQMSGLLLRTEGAVLTLADSQGKEIVVKSDDIEKRVLKSASPMPSDWGERLSQTDFHHLLGYLLEQRAK